MKAVVSMLVSMSAAGALLAAPDEGPPADLSALVRLAEASSPALRAAEARAEAASHRPSQAGTLPDPMVSIAYVNDGLSSITLGDSIMSNLALTWSQDLPYPGKRDLSAHAARAEAEVAQRTLERMRLEIAAAVKAGYATLYRLDRTATLLEETRTVLESLARAARSRYEVGEGIQESVFKAQTEIVRLEAEQTRVAQERRAARARLNALTGRLPATPIGAALTLPEGGLPADAASLADAAIAGSPEIGRLEASLRRAEADKERARLDLKPDFTWSASYMYRDGIDPMVMGLFGFRLPVYRDRRQAQALAENEAALRAARHELEDERIRTRASVDELVSEVERAERLTLLYEQGVIPQARGALESALASYGVGRIGFLDILNDVAVLLEARIELASQESDRTRALAALEPLVARALIPLALPGDTAGGSDAEQP